MKQTMRNALEANPVIAAVKDEEGLQQALKSRCRVIFLLFGDLMSAPGLVKRVQGAGKLVFCYMDAMEGLSGNRIAVDSLNAIAGPSGIISTSAVQVRRARHLGMLTVQRFLVADSATEHGLLPQLKIGKPDYVEIMPGLMPRVIAEAAKLTEAPLIASGLIQDRQEVLAALNAGAMAISSTAPAVWAL